MKLPKELHGIEVVNLKPTPDGRLRVMLRRDPDSGQDFVSTGFEQEKGESEIAFMEILDAHAKKLSESKSRVSSLSKEDYSRVSEKRIVEQMSVSMSTPLWIHMYLSAIIVLLVLIALLLSIN